MIVEHLERMREKRYLDEALSTRDGFHAELGAVDVREFGAKTVASSGHCCSEKMAEIPFRDVSSKLVPERS